jgi:hypothetical protein
MNDNLDKLDQAIQALRAQVATTVQGPPGATGATGPTGLVWMGPWSSVISYPKNAGVSYNGASYIALGPNSAVQPDINPNTWGVLAVGGVGGGDTVVPPSLNNLPFTSSLTVDFSTLNATQRVVVTTDVSITLTGAVAGQDCKLIVVQDSVGGHQISGWASNVLGGALLPSGATPNTSALFVFHYDGTNYLLSNIPIANQ